VADESDREDPAGDDAGGGRGLTRRQALIAGAGAVGVLALGGFALTRAGAGGSSGTTTQEADVVLRPQVTTVELGRRTATTWTYGGRLPGRELRLRQGRPISIRVDNALPEKTSVHWHGIRLANAADGVPGVTQDPIAPGGSFLYEFTPPDAGTYFFHPHTGVQLDRGLYAPLVVEPRDEPDAPDEDVVLMLDDWLDGVDGTPDERLQTLKRTGMQMSGMSMGMNGMDMGGMEMGGGGTAATGPYSDLAGMPPGAGSLPALANAMEAGSVDPGDIRDYPLYLVNGRPPEDPFPVTARQGARVRLRIVNAASDSVFCVFVDGVPLTVTHTDGRPVAPLETDALVVGMGERYDVVLRMPSSACRIIAAALGKSGRAVATLRPRGSSARPPAPSAPYATPERIADYADMRPIGETPDAGKPRETMIDLGMGSGMYSWTINGRSFPDTAPIAARRGSSQRFVMRNRTMMPHPMHLHGHVFTVGGGGPVKDTVIVPPMRAVAVDWLADNPGSWAFHCHNIYHAESGMMSVVTVE